MTTFPSAQELHQVLKKVAQVAATDPDPVVQSHADAWLRALKPQLRRSALLAAERIFENPLRSQAKRLLALDAVGRIALAEGS